MGFVAATDTTPENQSMQAATSLFLALSDTVVERRNAELLFRRVIAPCMQCGANFSMRDYAAESMISTQKTECIDEKCMRIGRFVTL